jgi:kynurenine formamidase
LSAPTKTGDASFFWQGHLVGRRKPYWQMEQLRGLDQLPSHGFDVGVFPLRLKDASAAPARVVGFLYYPENLFLSFHLFVMVGELS